MKGIVKTFDTNRKFGFIIAEGEEKDILFHESDLVNPDAAVQEGDIVEFDAVIHKKKGTSAKNVKIVTEPGMPEYIMLGTLRIRPAAVREFGIRDAAPAWLKKANELEVLIWEAEQKMSRNGENNSFQEIYYDQLFERRERLGKLYRSPEYQAALKGEIPELYVITVSGKELTFGKDEFDIYAKAEELKNVCV